MTTSLFAPAIHVRFQGRSLQLNAGQLGLAANAHDIDIKRAVANQLDVALSALQFHVVERHQNGNITVRPEAVFG